MSHRDDPHTSHEAAEKAASGTKLELLYGAILEVLGHGPATPAEVLERYLAEPREGIAWLPDVDLYDIRRRMTELQQQGRIAPIVVGTRPSGKPRFDAREGQRVMRLTEAAAA